MVVTFRCSLWLAGRVAFHTPGRVACNFTWSHGLITTYLRNLLRDCLKQVFVQSDKAAIFASVHVVCIRHGCDLHSKCGAFLICLQLCCFAGPFKEIFDPSWFVTGVSPGNAGCPNSNHSPCWNLQTFLFAEEYFSYFLLLVKI